MSLKQFDYKKVLEFIKCNYKAEDAYFNEENTGVIIPESQSEVLLDYNNRHSLSIEDSSDGEILVSVGSDKKFKEYYHVWQYESDQQEKILDAIKDEPFHPDDRVIEKILDEQNIGLPATSKDDFLNQMVKHGFLGKESVGKYKVTDTADEYMLEHNGKLPLIEIDTDYFSCF